ncbi:hypothetical protein [Actinomadura macrotermitis]|uniref:Uncharacterized protein n=1 Tax=Actinomadura macrotermitis TaxID=2585200 RepID=A0A7K0BN77_9ACTN|nr:hypothetical protein [Actinomadura macrotermitis]MQY02174.1 hypothetical protein [Actinomadura macrotermitis]
MNDERPPAPDSPGAPQAWAAPGSAGQTAPAAPQAAPPAYGPLPGQGGPPPKRRTGLIVGLAVGCTVALVAVAAGGAVMLARTDEPKAKNDAATATTGAPSASAKPAEPARRLTVPSAVAGYDRQTGNVAKRLIESMRKEMASGSDQDKAMAKHAKAALYSSGDEQVIFLGFSVADMGGPASGAKPEEQSQLVDGIFLGGGVSDTTDHPAGPLGGVLRCGKIKSDGTAIPTCAWADASVSGMLMVPGMPIKKLAGLTVKFRAAAEH